MVSRSVFVVLLVGSLVFFAGCSSPDETEEPDAGEVDTGVDADGDGDADTGDPDGDGDIESCEVQNDCGDDEYCHDGECHEAPTCSQLAEWTDCVDYFDGVDESLARRGYCDGSHCRISCILDEDCADGDLCSDHGRCIPFTGELTDVHPGGSESTPLQAGVGNSLMNFPIGLSQGGFGSRASINAGRYVESLRQSRGKMHGLYARGIAVDDGTRQLVFLRAPIIFPSMALHEAVARNLQAQTGADWRSSLVISGTHTHSGPARFWQIPRPDYTELPMGMLGIDEFSQQAFDWLVGSLTDAAMEALDDLSPAKMGWTVVESFDTDDVISSDRWSEKPPFDDNRALLLRIDDMEDNPRALLISFGTHGTLHSGPYMTADAMVGIERQLEKAIGETYDTYAPVMYFNQNGGNMSPRGGSAGHSGAQRFESLGAFLVDRTFDSFQAIEMTDEWSFSGHTHRFPIVYEYFGYEGYEFGDPSEDTKDGKYLFGGLVCNLNSGEGFDEHVHPEDYGCMGVHQLAFHRPISLFGKSQISAFQLNDLTLITMPGELTMPLGWQVQRDVRDAWGIDPFESFTFGYAQDHLLYLVPTNLRGERPPFPGLSLPEGMAPDDYPDYAISILQGGYEAESSPWGYRLGDFLAARAVEAVGLMLGEEVEPEFPVPYPEEFSYRDETPFPVDVTESSVVGEFVEQPPAQLERRQPIDIAWRGGDPGAEMPQAPTVTLERADGDGVFEPVIMPSRAVYTNREYVMFTRLRRVEDQWEWAVYWEELKDFPLGMYRFRVNGHYLNQDEDRTPYETFSDEFELVPSTALVVNEVSVEDASTISFRLSYPPANETEIGGPSPDFARLTGSFRMHHQGVPSGQLIPVEEFDRVEAEITQNGSALAVDNVTFDTTTTGLPVTRVRVHLETPLVAGEVGIELEAFDVYENSGSVGTTLEFGE